MKLLYPQYICSMAGKILVLALTFSSLNMNAQLQGSSKELVFRNGFLTSGTAGANGAVYRFNSVDNKLDATVKIVGRSDNKVKLLSIDITSGGWDKAFQPQVTYNNDVTPNGISDWYMEFEISFLLRGTNTLTAVGQFDCSGIDIDGNGHLISENATFYGLEYYILEANSLLQITNITNAQGGVIAKKFQGPVINFVSIDTTGTPVMVTARFKDKNKITIRAGAHSNGASTAADRLYAFWFRSFNYNSAEVNILPLKMNSFNAKLNSNKIMLNWEVSEQQNISHYIVERSLDGVGYAEAGLVFANNDGLSKYNYTDVINGKKRGMIYYRLKAVSTVGTHIYSSTRIIRMEEVQTYTVSTYPNPCVNELRISVPQKWQDQKITYELYNLKGQLVKRVDTNKASQTEVINVASINSGMYALKITSVEGVASHQIVKSK